MNDEIATQHLVPSVAVSASDRASLETPRERIGVPLPCTPLR
jgi:hypothetical protein